MIPSLFKQFQHWAEKGSVYIISDTHFDDPDSKIMDPYWPDPDVMVSMINKVVHKNDCLIILGDIGDPEYVKKLKAGRKVLLLGNHDRGESYYEPYFDEIYHEMLPITSKIVLSHVPLLDDRWFNIHGHNHAGNAMYEGNGLNLVANVCSFTPINLGAVIKSGILKDQKTITEMAIDKAKEFKII